MNESSNLSTSHHNRYDGASSTDDNRMESTSEESFWMSLVKSPFDLSNWTSVSDEGRLYGSTMSAMGDGIPPIDERSDVQII